MDDTDRALIALLRKDARMNIATLASKLGVSRGTVTNRLRKLETADGTETVPALHRDYSEWFGAFETFSVGVFTVEYLARLWTAVEVPFLRRHTPWRARFDWARRPYLVIDLLAILPFYVHHLMGLDLRFVRVLRLLRFLKLSRYSPAMHTLVRVLYNERRALMGAGHSAEALAFVATLEDGSALPDWLSFDAASGVFSGTPGSGDVGLLRIRLEAYDALEASAHDVFSLDVSEANRVVGTPGDDRLTGTAAPDGKGFTFVGEMSDPMMNKVLPTKQIVSFPDANHMHFEMWSPGPDGKDMKWIEIDYTRKM